MPAPFRGGLTLIPGSTFGGVTVPFCWDKRLLKVAFGRSIFSGGGAEAFGGAIGTVGLVGDAGCGFCARAGHVAMIKTVNESVRSMMRISFSSRSPAGTSVRRHPARPITRHGRSNHSGPRW